MSRKDPPANTSDEAIALRVAATKFATYRDNPEDADDRKGQRLNAALLSAAVKYAAVVPVNFDDLSPKVRASVERGIADVKAGRVVTRDLPALVSVTAVVKALTQRRLKLLAPDWTKWPKSKMRDMAHYLEGLDDAVRIVQHVARLGKDRK